VLATMPDQLTTRYPQSVVPASVSVCFPHQSTLSIHIHKASTLHSQSYLRQNSCMSHSSDPISEISLANNLAKTAAQLMTKLYNFGKTIKDRGLQQQIDEMVDQLRDLKQAASQLEDENRELREKARFKSDDYEFRDNFWYEKQHPDRPLCPVCFSKGIAGPVDEPYQGKYRCCLVCGKATDIRGRQRVDYNSGTHFGGEW